jgi:hypothetical protein
LVGTILQRDNRFGVFISSFHPLTNKFQITSSFINSYFQQFMSKRLHIRRRQDSDDEDDNQPVEDDTTEQNSNDEHESGYDNISFFTISFIFFYRTAIEDLKLIQKLRQRKKGLSSDELAHGKQVNPLSYSRKFDVCYQISYH